MHRSGIYKLPPRYSAQGTPFLLGMLTHVMLAVRLAPFKHRKQKPDTRPIKPHAPYIDTFLIGYVI
ncbi:MAG: hypothetical protein FWH22_07765, partial [Fibromonadales bacterium]|nr:hypothetical protein [Fibromonadales bacterium]